MIKNAVILVLLVLIGATYVSADDPYADGAPVQIQMQTEKSLLMYSCYPSNGASPLMVYIQFSTGLAEYACDYVEGTWIRPIYPLTEKAASLQHTKNNQIADSHSTVQVFY